MKSGILSAVALATACLSACGSSAPPPAEASPSSDLAASNARLFLAPVKGNAAAVYFDIANKGQTTWSIQGASLKGAQMTMLHTVGGPNMNGGMGEVLQVLVHPGETVHFEPGKLHVMVMDPPADLTRGAKSELTLNFLGGDKMSFPVEVKAAGDAR